MLHPLYVIFLGGIMWNFFGQLANFYNSLEYNYSLNIIMFNPLAIEQGRIESSSFSILEPLVEVNQAT